MSQWLSWIYCLVFSFSFSLAFAKLAKLLLGKINVKQKHSKLKIHKDKNSQSKMITFQQQILDKQRKNTSDDVKGDNHAVQVEIQQFIRISIELLERVRVIQKVRETLVNRTKTYNHNEIIYDECYQNNSCDSNNLTNLINAPDYSDQKVNSIYNCNIDAQASESRQAAQQSNPEQDILGDKYKILQSQIDNFVLENSQYFQRIINGRFIWICANTFKQLQIGQVNKDIRFYQRHLKQFLRIKHQIKILLQWQTFEANKNTELEHSKKLTDILQNSRKQLQSLKFRISQFFIPKQSGGCNHQELIRVAIAINQLGKKKQHQSKLVPKMQNNIAVWGQYNQVDQDMYNKTSSVSCKQNQQGNQLTEFKVYQIYSGQEIQQHSEQAQSCINATQSENKISQVKSYRMQNVIHERSSRKLFMKQLQCLLTIGNAKKQEQFSDEYQRNQLRQEILSQTAIKSQTICNKEMN